MTLKEALRLYTHAKSNRTIYDADGKPIDIDNRIKEEKKFYKGGATTYDKTNSEDSSLADCHRNVCFELIDSQIDVSIPLPKVTSRDKENEYQTKNIENYLMAEISRLRLQEINNAADRSCLKHGTVFYHVQWDEMQKTPTSNGELVVKVFTIEDVYPQPFVKRFEDIEYLFVKETVSAINIKRVYGVDIPEDPTRIGLNTMITMWYYDDSPKQEVSKFAWIENTEFVVFDIHGYQLRRVLVCDDCDTQKTGDEDECLNCANDTFHYENKQYEDIKVDIVEGDPFTPDSEFDETNKRPEPVVLVNKDTEFPYYTIERLPFVCRVNIPDDDSLYGISDIQLLKTNQEALNTVNTKQVENILDSSVFVMSSNKVKIDARKRGRIRHVKSNNPQDAQYMKAMRVDAVVQQDSIYTANEYLAAQNIVGVTDAYQGKKDYTATSGKAVQIKAAQAASRLDSKKQMKDAAFAKLYEMMFQFLLAYCDEKRLFQSDELEGKKQDYFIRYSFIDGTPEHAYYNDRYIFDTDTSTALSTDRAALWEQTFQIYAQGALGQPGQPDTLKKLWRLLRKYNYPLAGTVLEYFAQGSEQLPQNLQDALMNHPEMLQQLMSQIQQSEGGQPVQAQNTLAARGGNLTPSQRGIAPQSKTGVRPPQGTGGTYGTA